jgi:transcriptional regulator with XRE-family HTH domain
MSKQQSTRTIRTKGSKIRELRVARGWSQKVLWDRADISKGTLLRVEDSQEVLLKTATAIADALEVPLQEIADVVAVPPGEEPVDTASPVINPSAAPVAPAIPPLSPADYDQALRADRRIKPLLEDPSCRDAADAAIAYLSRGEKCQDEAWKASSAWQHVECVFKELQLVWPLPPLEHNPTEHQGEHLSAHAPLTREIVNSLGMKLVLVPGGTFWMGDHDSQSRAIVSHDFYIGRFPVTQRQWQVVMGSNPSHFSRHGAGAVMVMDFSDSDLEDFPVELVSYEDVQQFLNTLNALETDGGFLGGDRRFGRCTDVRNGLRLESQGLTAE